MPQAHGFYGRSQSRSCVPDELIFTSLAGHDPSFAECQAWHASLASTRKLGCQHHIAFLLLSGHVLCMAPSSCRGAELHSPWVLKASLGVCWCPRQHFAVALQDAVPGGCSVLIKCDLSQ